MATSLFILFISLCKISCVLGTRPTGKGKPDKPSDPPSGPPASEAWVPLDVPDFSFWQAQEGFGCQYGICGWGNGEFQFYHPDPFNHGLLHAVSYPGTDLGQSLTVRGTLDQPLIQQAVGGDCESWCIFTSKLAENIPDCRNRCTNGKIVSARIHSKGVFSFAPNYPVIGGANAGETYTSYKISMKVCVEDGTGLWPAVWLLPENDASDPDRPSSGYGEYGPWPFSGEIDVFESANNMRRQWITIHYAADQYGTHVDMGKSSSFDTNLHTIEFIWNPDSMVWLKDGRKVQTLSGWNAYTPSHTSPSAPFDKRFYLLINLAFGGGHTGQTDPATVENTLAVQGGRASFEIQDLNVWGLNY